MLNINQNFDLKAPVFNFDRDYFNSVEELKDYDTSNVPNHFVTNVAGMLYLFTDGKWIPMIGFTKDNVNNNLLLYLSSNLFDQNNLSFCYISKNTNGFNNFRIGNNDRYSELLSNCTLNLNKLAMGNGDYESTSILLNAYDTSATELHYSPVNIKLSINNSNNININPGDGFYHDFWKSGKRFRAIQCSASNITMYSMDNIAFNINPTNDGSEISGIKSLIAFSNPSATKVWATDGSTANMPTKFSDLKNDAVYITGNKGESDSKFKIDYKDGDVLRSILQYSPRITDRCIPELSLCSYDTSGHNLSQLRIRPEDNRDDGQYLIQIQNVIEDKINTVTTLSTQNMNIQNFKDNESVNLRSNELIFYNDPNGNQIQLKINKDGITKTNGKSTEVFVTDGSIANLNKYAKLGGDNFIGWVRLTGGFDCAKLGTYGGKYLPSAIQVDQSPTKVYTTDGNLADLSTKANSSDVLLKKSTSGGYYIEQNDNVVGANSFVVNTTCAASGRYGTAEGYFTKANGDLSHAEGNSTIASGVGAHAQGFYNIDNKNAIHSVGIGINLNRKNAEYIYAQTNETNNNLIDNPKNGYKYLIGVGGYDGISTDNSTYKSVQEVIADLTARIEQLEKLLNQKIL